MNRCLLYTILFVIYLGTFSMMDAGAKRNPAPAIYNIEELNKLRKDFKTGTPKITSFLKEAEMILTSRPVSVMDKNKSFVNNKHFYCSISRYAWPREDDKTVYIIKDGKTNPEYYDFDLPRLETLRDRLKTLSVAFYITNDIRYYNGFVNHLNAWVLDKETYMKPNMMYSEVLPGSNKKTGMSYGLVELERFTPIIESICLVQSVKKLDRRTSRGVTKWFEALLSWTMGSEQWNLESNRTNSNNIVAGLYVTLLEMARFTNNKKIIQKLGHEYKEKILDVQIDAEGKQISELKRAMGYGYSVANLNNVVDFCLIMEQSGIHFYKDNQQKIDNAFNYLFQFVENHDAFPYEQISGWEHYEQMLQRNALRLTRMEASRPYAYELVNYNIDNYSVLEYVY